jgi:hypothetical protein
MSMCGEIENCKYAISRLHSALANPNLSTDDKMRLVSELAWEKQQLEALERQRLKEYK